MKEVIIMTNNKGIEIRFIIPTINRHVEGFDRDKERESIERLNAALKELEDYINHENWEYQTQWFVKDGDKTYDVTYTTSRDEREVCIWCGCASRFIDITMQPFWRCISDHMKLVA
jgi:hypothetical protein